MHKISSSSLVVSQSLNERLKNIKTPSMCRTPLDFRIHLAVATLMMGPLLENSSVFFGITDKPRPLLQPPAFVGSAPHHQVKCAPGQELLVAQPAFAIRDAIQFS